MAREIVVLCDPCLAEDVRTAATEHVLGIALGTEGQTSLPRPGAPKSIACCQQHSDQLLKPLAALIEEFGSPVDASPKAPADDGSRKSGRGGRVPAEELAGNALRKGRRPTEGRPTECLWCDLSYTAKSGSGFGRHLRTQHGFAGFVEAFGGDCPLCGEGPYDLMMSHINKTHPEMGFISVTQPFMWARDNGDPHGVYALTVAKKGSLDPDEEWRRTRDRENAESEAREARQGKAAS